MLFAFVWVVVVVVVASFVLNVSNPRDDEAEVRQAVEKCAAAVGSADIDLSAVMDVLLPVLRGEVRRLSRVVEESGSIVARCHLNYADS